MEAFYRTHAYLVEHTNAPVRRDLMDEIDWNDRLIGIKGTRGVGKTTFLLQYAKEKFGTDRSCLFINMNNFYFSGHGIVEFAAEFQRRGGKVLLIDQVFKYPEWSKELRMCYDRFPNLKIRVHRLVRDASERGEYGVARHREELQPARLLLPRIPEPADGHEVPCLSVGRNPEQPRTDSQRHPLQSTSIGLHAGLYAPRLLPFLPRKA